jgi:hypothetical protein
MSQKTNPPTCPPPLPHGLACDYQILTFHAKNNNNLTIFKNIIIAESIQVLQYICL